MPQDVWDWFGNIAHTIVNSLIMAGQVIYGGLIAIGNFFVALGEAIVAWGMALIGTYQTARATLAARALLNRTGIGTPTPPSVLSTAVLAAIPYQPLVKFELRRGNPVLPSPPCAP